MNKINQYFLEAISTKNIKAMRKLAEKGADVDVLQDGKTPLAIELEKDNYEIDSYAVAKELVALGADVKKVSQDTFDDMEIKARMNEFGGHAQIIQILAKHGANIDLTKPDLAQSIKKNQRLRDGQLSNALNQNDLPAARTYVEYGANPDNALLRAIFRRHTASVKFFLEHGANPNTNYDMESCLTIAMNKKADDITDLLLTHGAIPDYQDMKTAASVDNLELFKRLHAIGGPIEKSESIMRNDEALLFIAVEKDQVDIAKYLIEHGANVNYGKKDITLLTTAIQKEHWDMVDLLLENGAEPKAKESQAVVYAAVYNKFDLVERLVDLGGKIEHNQNTPIMRAAANHSLEALKTCARLGGDIHYDGSDLLYRTVCDGSIETMSYLIEQGQDIHAKYRDGDCLTAAAGKNDLEKVEFLLSKGANPNAHEDTIYYPIVRGNNEVAKVLFEAGADPTAKNDKALYDAIRVENTEIYTYLIAERKMPVRAETRDWLENTTNNESAIHANQLLKKRDLHEKLQLNLNTPKATAQTPTKKKSFSLKI